jgi:xanthine dehydrogenase YagS FAD-binding subunit
MAVALSVLDARIETLRANGQTRSIPIGELHRLPGDTPHIETELEKGELIVAVTLPSPPAGVQRYRKVRDRASYAFALVSLAAVVDVQDRIIRHARLAFGGLAHKPWRALEAERVLIGAPAETRTFVAAAEQELRVARGYGGNDFKIELARRVLVRMLAQLTAADEN